MEVNLMTNYTITINNQSDTIKTVEIIEGFNTKNQSFFHRILYKNFNNVWTDWSWVKDPNSKDLECAQCIIP
jgi:hypothetical protein